MTKNNNSITIDLENLRTQYSNLLISYKSAVAEYSQYLSSMSTNNCENYITDSSGITQDCNSKHSLVTIKGQSFNGTGSAGESNATTLEDCVEACSSSQKCTGATFVSNKCLIRTGDSNLVTASNNTYAIIPKNKQLLLNMENINQQLLAVNQQLLEKTKQTQPIYDKMNTDININSEELVSNYESLIQERDNIMELLKQHETLENTENQNQIKITQNYYIYMLLFAITVIIIILLGVFVTSSGSNQNIQRGGNLNKNTYYIVFALILVIALINYFTK
jgi:hypothetical protein